MASNLPRIRNQEKYLLENLSRDSLCWLEGCTTTVPFFQAKIFQIKKQQKYFELKCNCNFLLLCSVLLMISVWQHLMKPMVKNLSFL